MSAIDWDLQVLYVMLKNRGHADMMLIKSRKPANNDAFIAANQIRIAVSYKVQQGLPIPAESTKPIPLAVVSLAIYSRYRDSGNLIHSCPSLIDDKAFGYFMSHNHPCHLRSYDMINKHTSTTHRHDSKQPQEVTSS